MYILIIIFLNSTMYYPAGIEFSSVDTCEAAKAQMLNSPQFKYTKNYASCVKK